MRLSSRVCLIRDRVSLRFESTGEGWENLSVVRIIHAKTRHERAFPQLQRVITFRLYSLHLSAIMRRSLWRACEDASIRRRFFAWGWRAVRLFDAARTLNFCLDKRAHLSGRFRGERRMVEEPLVAGSEETCFRAVAATARQRQNEGDKTVRSLGNRAQAAASRARLGTSSFLCVCFGERTCAYDSPYRQRRAAAEKAV